MGLDKINYGPFSRIGDRYATFIDPEHFLGRTATDETWIAPMNSSRNEKGYDLEVMLPGFSKEEISVSIDGNILEVEAHKEAVDERKYLSRQIPTSFAARRFQLPETVDRDSVRAKLENGILKLTLFDKKNGMGNGNRTISIN